MRKSLSKQSRAHLVVFLSLLASCGGGGGGSSDGPAMYSVGGSVSGLAGTLVLQLNGGGDTSILANSGFTFPTSLPDGTTYAVTVLAQPAAQRCSVANGVGDLAGANVTGVAVTCGPSSFSVGGTISGLTGTVVLQDNGGDNLSRSASGDFTFATPVADLGAYAVTVLTQPVPPQFCSVASGSGTLASANVTSVAVTCSATSFSVGGTLSGLNGTLVLQDNGGDNLTRTTNNAFTFAAPVAQGGAYSVTVLSKPAKQSCTVTAGSGTIAGASVTNVAVACVDYNVMFVTSTTSSGNLGGLAGADAKCNALAGAAGLSGTYVAWLGIFPTMYPPSRLGTARGWVRPDGSPFLDTVNDLASYKMFYPPRITELNASVAPGAGGGVFTGGSASLVYPSTCVGWTSAAPAEHGLTGNAEAGGLGWTNGSASSCDSQGRIYCFGVGAAAPLTFAPASGRLAFLSNARFSPNSGIAAADAICRNEAVAAALPQTYKALLAMPGASAISRFPNVAPGDTFVRPDGVLAYLIPPVYTGTTVLTAPIYVTAAKSYLPGISAWLGAGTFDAAGESTGTCNGWTSNASGIGGGVMATDYTVFTTNSHITVPPCSISPSPQVICLQE